MSATLFEFAFAPIEASKAVTQVPIFAPRTINNARSKGKTLFPTIVITTPVAADELCINAVNIILMNFFRQLPQSVLEAAYIDGASHFRTLFQVVVPMSLPSIATLTLFSFVTHWNSWFDGLLLMNSPANYPLQSYLQTVIVNRDMSLMSTTDILTSSLVSDSTSKAAQTFVAALPVMIIYPFLQKYFAAGIQLGSVKE